MIDRAFIKGHAASDKVSSQDEPTEVQGENEAHLETRAVQACLSAKSQDPRTKEERLRRIIEAGRLLRAVERSWGARTDLIKPLDEVTT